MDEDETDDEHESRSERKLSRAQSRALLTPAQPVKNRLMFLPLKHVEGGAEDVFV